MIDFLDNQTPLISHEKWVLKRVEKKVVGFSTLIWKHFDLKGNEPLIQWLRKDLAEKLDQSKVYITQIWIDPRTWHLNG